MDKRTKLKNIRAKTIKILDENIREYLHDIEFGNNFMDMAPKAVTKRTQ